MKGEKWSGAHLRVLRSAKTYITRITNMMG